ncbi:nitrite reductase [Acidobacteria bacterium Mor1]|nr:nitrite reductase [Acidobacteria bacterium Mor1]
MYILVFIAALIATLLVTWVLLRMIGRKQEGAAPFVKLAELSEISSDPAPWGLNWPHHYDGYIATAGDRFYGGSSAMPQSKLDHQPWLKRLYSGYAFSIDYREARGHAYMLYDQGVTERVTKKPQAGACLHCHGSTTVMYRREGLKAMGQPYDDEALAASFNMDAVIRGFEEVSRLPYQEVLAKLQEAPDGTPDGGMPFPAAPAGGFTGEYAGQPLPEGHQSLGDAHPVSCIDCHNPKTMKLRITRPGFMSGIAMLAESDEPTPHLPSVEKWRRGDRSKPYDPNVDATRQEMRSYVCGQCHVEYYCANKDVLSFPWSNGLKMEQLEQHWAEKTFDDGTPFFDYRHGETGTPLFKVQHPEFELWSQGIHAQNGVSCSDCHMPYERVGATKLSTHNVASPLETIGISCQKCHSADAADLRHTVETIQARNGALMERAAEAMTDMLDAILQAKASGVDDERLAAVYENQSKAMWRLDYISSENSRGFHASQEAARILGESIDHSRRAERMALQLRAGETPDIAGMEKAPVIGVSDKSNRVE